MNSIDNEIAALGFPNFEKEDFCVEQNAAMLKRIATYAPNEHHYFTQLLASNDPADPRDGDWLASRKARRRFILGAEEQFRNRDDLLFVTWAHPYWRILPGDLHTFNWEAARQIIYRRLTDLKQGVLAAGGFEFRLTVDFNKSREWEGHIHLVTAGVSPTKLKHVFKTARGIRYPHEKPLHIVNVGDLPSRLGYSSKRVIKQSVSYIDKFGLTRQRKLPLRPRDQVEYDLWLLNLRAGSRQIFHGLRMHGDRLHRLHRDE